MPPLLAMHRQLSAQYQREKVAELPRPGERYPYVVEHDHTVNRPWGVFRVLIDGREIGRLASFPGAADCSRMEFAPPVSLHAAAHESAKAAAAARGVAQRRGPPRMSIAESTALIDSRGGAVIVASKIGVSEVSVYEWRREGLPVKRIASIRDLPPRTRPDVQRPRTPRKEERLTREQSVELIDSRGGERVIGPRIQLSYKTLYDWRLRGIPVSQVKAIRAMPLQRSTIKRRVRRSGLTRI
jgi:hypothetical protein